MQQLRTFRLARDPGAQVATLSRLLTEAKIDHAVTGAAAAAQLAPFITTIPVTDVWVTEVRALADVAAAAGAEAVRDGHNVAFRHAKDDIPLTLRAQHNGAWLANNFRIYLDLLADPRRGREQADRLREGVIGC